MNKLLSHKKKLVSLVAIVMVLAVAAGSNIFTKEPPEFPCSQDPDQVISIDGEQVPMGNTDLGSKTTRKSSTKKIKMKTAAKKSYTKNLPTKTKTTTKTVTKTSSKEKVVTKTKTVVKTSTKETFKKSSKVKTVKQTVETTVSTTTTKTQIASNTSDSSSSSSAGATATSSSSDGTYAVNKIAPKAEGRVRDAFEKLGFEIVVKSGVSYAGKYDTKAQLITLKRQDDTVYHELGHFLGFLASNMDTSDEFKAIYNEEKSKYTGASKAYVTQNSSEYFAESFKEYTLNPSALKKDRPKTYAAMEEAVQLIDDNRISQYKAVYAPYWK